MGALTETAENGMEVYYSQVHQALDEYISDRQIEDMSKEPQSKWNAAMMYICDHVFKGTDILKTGLYDNNKGGYIGIISNNNKYDIDKVNSICDYYLRLCYEYDKEVSINGFSFMTGISVDCIRGWSGALPGTYAEGLKASPTGLVVYKKLTENNEESLSNMLISGKRPPVAILGALNRRHGWNMPGAGQSIEQGRPRETAEEIRQKYQAAALPEPPEEPEEDRTLQGAADDIV